MEKFLQVIIGENCYERNYMVFPDELIMFQCSGRSQSLLLSLNCIIEHGVCDLIDKFSKMPTLYNGSLWLSKKGSTYDQFNFFTHFYPHELSIHFNLKLINYNSRLDLITTHLCNIKQLNFKVQENIIFSYEHGDAENTTPPLQKRNPPLNFKCP